MATLSYAVSLKKPGMVTFEYFYPDNSIYFEFFVSVARMRCCRLRREWTPPGTKPPNLYPRLRLQVQNDQCQSTESESRWMKITESSWSRYGVGLLCTLSQNGGCDISPDCNSPTSAHVWPAKLELSSGNNVLYWRTTAYSLQGDAVKPVMLRNIAVSGNAAASRRPSGTFCFICFQHVNNDNKKTK